MAYREVLSSDHPILLYCDVLYVLQSPLVSLIKRDCDNLQWCSITSRTSINLIAPGLEAACSSFPCGCVEPFEIVDMYPGLSTTSGDSSLFLAQVRYACLYLAHGGVP